MSHPLRDNLRLIDRMLLAGPLIYIAVLAALVIAWQRMWVSVLAAFVTLGQQQPLWGHCVVCLCRVAGFHGARQATHRIGSKDGWGNNYDRARSA
jgi:hypothetical protein